MHFWNTLVLLLVLNNNYLDKDHTTVRKEGKWKSSDLKPIMEDMVIISIKGAGGLPPPPPLPRKRDEYPNERKNKLFLLQYNRENFYLEIKTNLQ